VPKDDCGALSPAKEKDENNAGGLKMLMNAFSPAIDNSAKSINRLIGSAEEDG
jgi:hypothetical protein